MITINKPCQRWRMALIVTFLFNIIDTIITLTVTQRGFVELNPVARILLYSPFAFEVVKFGVVSLLLLWLWLKRAERLARVAGWCSLVIYGAVMLHYCITFMIYLQ